ncbi:MAG: NYN domain-containing protein [Candidatus Omnitrophota bacterium]
MSLQYIIDGYNVTNHPKFAKQIPRKNNLGPREELIRLIRAKKSASSPNNKFWVVFDGYPAPGLDNSDKGNIMVIFSRAESADERIKKLVELIPNPGNVVVVSDDKEIGLFARFSRARQESVEDFLLSPDKLMRPRNEPPEPEITYAQMHKINEELRKLWLS